MKLAVCSNKRVEFTRELVAALGLGDYFACVLGPDDVDGRSKPCHTAQETYDLIAPLLQSKIVAPQADTNKAIKDALAALATNDQTEATRIITAIGMMLAPRVNT